MRRLSLVDDPYVRKRKENEINSSPKDWRQFHIINKKWICKLSFGSIVERKQTYIYMNTERGKDESMMQFLQVFLPWSLFEQKTRRLIEFRWVYFQNEFIINMIDHRCLNLYLFSFYILVYRSQISTQ